MICKTLDPFFDSQDNSQHTRQTCRNLHLTLSLPPLASGTEDTFKRPQHYSGKESKPTAAENADDDALEKIVDWERRYELAKEAFCSSGK
jgi:hypothetical protein